MEQSSKTEQFVQPPSAQDHDLAGLGEVRGFAFGDEDRSRLEALRDSPLSKLRVYHLVFTISGILWTAVFTIALAIHSRPDFAVQNTPHISQFVVFLGMILFPRKLLWYPILLFTVLYQVTLYAPMMAVPGDGAIKVLSINYATNLTIGAAAGLFLRYVHKFLLRLLSATTADVLLIGGSFALVIPLVLATLAAQTVVGGVLGGQAWVDAGFNDLHVPEVIYRGVRAAFVAALVLTLAVDPPTRKVWPKILAVMPIFVLMIIAYYTGLSRVPVLEVTIVLVGMTSLLPVSVAPSAVFFGAVLYTISTGVFLDTTLGENLFAPFAELASAVLTFVLFAVMLNNIRMKFISDAQVRSLARIERVRNYADIGRFTVNTAAGMIYLDDASCRILRAPHVVELADFASRLNPEDAAKIANGLQHTTSTSTTMTLQLPVHGMRTEEIVVKCFVCYERSSSSEKTLAYGFIVDVTSEWDQGLELHRALKELSEKQERQKELFSIISHELRTPASILSMLLANARRDGNWDAVSDQLGQASEQLLTTLGDMRQAVYPEKNLPVKITPFLPAELLDRVKAGFADMSSEAGVAVRLDIDEAARRPCMGDVHRIRQAISNLLRNVLLHADATEVTLSYRRVADSAGGDAGQWIVSDDGRGIPQDEVERIFEPFQRIVDRKRGTDGSGLGLYIVKTSTELLGGSVRYSGESSGGARFTIEVPEPAMTAADHARLANRDVPRGDRKEPAGPEPEAKLPLSVLVVEDSDIIRDIMAGMLAKFFAEVRTAPDGAQGWSAFNSKRPDVVFTDLFMPVMDGDELIREIRKVAPMIPIYGITAAVVGDDAERFREAGATEIMSKPLRMNTLRRIVDDVRKRDAA